MATGMAHAGADIAILDVSGEAAKARAASIATLGRRAAGMPRTPPGRLTWKGP